MNVAAAARAAGISPSGLRWYESIGVLPAAPRGENGYRSYTVRDVSLLRLVLTLRRLGLSTAEAGRLARLSFEGDASDHELRDALQRQRAVVTRQRADLDWLDGELRDLDSTLRATRRRVARRLPVAPISVLFLCNANSGRSQIGEALLTNRGGARFAVQSAGAHPTPVSELAVEVLAEVGPPETRLMAYRRTRDELSRRLVPFVELALRTAAPEHLFPIEENCDG